MMKDFWNTKRPTLFGVIHLLPLPGAPRWKGSMKEVTRRALADAAAYQEGGADGLVLENFGDVPFTREAVPPETVAAMSAVGVAVCQSSRLPLGFNVLRNDPRAALALCAACGGQFIRVNVHTGAMITDQGVIEGDAFGTLRRRQALQPSLQIFADVHVKHAVPLSPMPIGDAASDTVERGLADALILSGSATGAAVSLEDLREVRTAMPRARILLGSGVTLANLNTYRPWIDGVIVGSSLKRGGRLSNPVDPGRVGKLARALASVA